MGQAEAEAGGSSDAELAADDAGALGEAADGEAADGAPEDGGALDAAGEVGDIDRLGMGVGEG